LRARQSQRWSNPCGHYRSSHPERLPAPYRIDATATHARAHGTTRHLRGRLALADAESPLAKSELRGAFYASTRYAPFQSQLCTVFTVPSETEGDTASCTPRRHQKNLRWGVRPRHRARV